MEAQQKILLCCNCCSVLPAWKEPNAQQHWITIEQYLYRQFQQPFQHGYCPSCFIKNHPKQYLAFANERQLPLGISDYLMAGLLGNNGKRKTANQQASIFFQKLNPQQQKLIDEFTKTLVGMDISSMLQN